MRFHVAGALLSWEASAWEDAEKNSLLQLQKNSLLQLQDAKSLVGGGICPNNYDPVCSNRVTYSNKCKAAEAGVQNPTKGECKWPPLTWQCENPCVDATPSVRWCTHGLTRACLVEQGSPKWSCTKDCSAQPEMVCPTMRGSELTCSGDYCAAPYPAAYPECDNKVSFAFDHRPDTWFSKRLIERTRCSIQAYFGLPSNDGLCPCPNNYDPVCSNGVTYSNKCKAAEAGVQNPTKGECKWTWQCKNPCVDATPSVRVCKHGLTMACLVEQGFPKWSCTKDCSAQPELKCPTMHGSELTCTGDYCAAPYPAAYPECDNKVSFAFDHRPDTWFSKRAIERTRCSIQAYFSLPSNDGLCPGFPTDASDAPSEAPIGVSIMPVQPTTTAPTTTAPTTTAPANAAQWCGEQCRAKDYCCNDPQVGSNQMISCAQACLMRSQGVAEALMLSSKGGICDRNGNSGCFLKVMNGKNSYGFCGGCKDIKNHCPHGVQSASECDDGASLWSFTMPTTMA